MYEFDVTREWFVKAAPFLKIMASTLSLVLQVVAPAARVGVEEVAYKGIEKQLEFGMEGSDAMFESVGKATDWISKKEGINTVSTEAISAQGGLLREFQVWLKEKDPGYGDLRRVLNKQNQYMWVHRNFEGEY